MTIILLAEHIMRHSHEKYILQSVEFMLGLSFLFSHSFPLKPVKIDWLFYFSFVVKV